MESLFRSLPALISRQDSIFSFTLFVAAAAFAAAEFFWLIRFLRSRRLPAKNRNLPEDDTRFAVLWSVVPAFVLVLLAFVQVGPTKTHARNLSKASQSSRHPNMTRVSLPLSRP